MRLHLPGARCPGDPEARSSARSQYLNTGTSDGQETGTGQVRANIGRGISRGEVCQYISFGGGTGLRHDR